MLGGYGREGTIKIIDAFHEVHGKARNGKDAGGLDVTFRTFLKVSKIRDGAKVFILSKKEARGLVTVTFSCALTGCALTVEDSILLGMWRRGIGEVGRRTFKSIISRVLASSSFFEGSCSSSIASGFVWSDAGASVLAEASASAGVVE